MNIASIDSAVNENELHSHLGTLAGARVPGFAGRVKSFLQIFLVCKNRATLERKHKKTRLSSDKRVDLRVILC